MQEDSTGRATRRDRTPGPTEIGDAIHVVVLFGGRSAEHDVSCVTAAHVLRALDLDRYTVTVIGIDRSGVWHLAESAMNALGATLPEALLAEGPEVAASSVLAAAAAAGSPVVVLPLLHGPQGEDGTVQGLIELAGLPYVGSGVLGSAVSMDKTIAKAVLSAADIAQPRYRALHESEVSPESVADAVALLGLPVFVKPANMGSSIGVSKARTLEEVEHGVRIALAYDRWILIEEAVSGREIEVAVLGNDAPRASVPGEIVPAKDFYDYEDKYVTSGARLLVPAPLSDEESHDVRDLALRIFGALRGSGLARVDFFYEEDGRGFLCNEMNTMPGFTPISMYPKLWEASGTSYPDLIDELIVLALERHQQQRRKTAR